MASRKTLLAGLLIAVVCFCGAAWAQDTNYARDGDIWSAYENAYPTSYGATATTYHFGPVIDCRKVQGLSFAVTVGTGCGATTKVLAFLEELVDNPERPVGPYVGVTYTPGYAIDKWSVRQPLLMTKDLGTKVTEMVASDDYLATCTVQMPYARLCIYNAVADKDQCAVGAFVRKRYAPWVPAW